MSMTCDEIQRRLGELLDDELDRGLRSKLEQHLAGCQECRREYESLQALATSLGQPPESTLPSRLWEAIEGKLDQEHDGSPEAAAQPRRTGAIYRLGRRPLAAAAVIVAAIGLGWLAWQAPWASTAQAGQIDFRPLLAQADGDIEAGIKALLQAYGGEAISREQAAKRMRVRVHVPDGLPGELRLRSVYLLKMGRHHESLAFHFSGPRGQLLLLQCPAGIEKRYGNRECLPCQIGAHNGHGVRVGKLYLMHMMSENVCVCVVSTLDEPDLAQALDAVKIDF